jgi:flagellar hook assembly protein FlgD
MTITGKIVKTIMRDELGPLHVGRNITEYAWDGKDDFGDRLANGVYLYKVQTKLNGQSIERKSTGADQYFTKELVKMVIMR